MKTGANTGEAVIFKGRFCVLNCFVVVVFPVEGWYEEQSDCKHRMNFDTMELEASAEEVTTHSVEQRNRNIGRHWRQLAPAFRAC